MKTAEIKNAGDAIQYAKANIIEFAIELSDLMATKKIRPNNGIAWIPGLQSVLPNYKSASSEAAATTNQSHPGRDRRSGSKGA